MAEWIDITSWKSIKANWVKVILILAVVLIAGVIVIWAMMQSPK